ncbi:hypothetical protein H2200_009142 [Cladophialophora chaetospira]|uniref:Uncharacterized protein n=1 Tax=Cladophialophora chaetospira TaxID=386627 RepID=A0AA38X3R9_9EURO|nr:hypothetical protein H2200_009142 [Cladophialophora chaetospira]
MDHNAGFKLPRQEQLASVFFNLLPGETRDKIFTSALNCYEDPKKLWDVNTPYVRPGYSAAQVADTALLQTCQRIYAENWFRPWVSAVHTFYLTSQDRRPEDGYVTTIDKFQPRLNRLYVDHGEVEVSHVQVFAQMYALESLNSSLIPILRMENFFPRKLTVSLRHHDWWWWENDQRLQINGAWIRVCQFPDSLKEVCIELESLQRKKNQIDWIADEMVQSWHLLRLDGTIMSATKEDCKVSAWSGSSTWGGQRWIRDESQPGVNEYYVKTVTWKANNEKTNQSEPRTLQVPESFPVMAGNRASVNVSLLERAGIPAGLPGDETLQRVMEWERENRRRPETKPVQTRRSVHDGFDDEVQDMRDDFVQGNAYEDDEESEEDTTED